MQGDFGLREDKYPSTGEDWTRQYSSTEVKVYVLADTAVHEDISADFGGKSVSQEAKC